jgi:hypothetical protein
MTMTTSKLSAKSKHSFAALATAIILLAAPAAASAGSKIPIDPPGTPTGQPTPPPAPPQPSTGTVRDHRTPATVRDHRTQVRDHRTQTAPVPASGGVTVTSVPRKAKPQPQPGYNPVPGHY